MFPFYDRTFQLWRSAQLAWMNLWQRGLAGGTSSPSPPSLSSSAADEEPGPTPQSLSAPPSAESVADETSEPAPVVPAPAPLPEAVAASVPVADEKVLESASLPGDDALPDDDTLSVRDALPDDDTLSVRDALPVDDALSVRDVLPVDDALSVRDVLSVGDAPLVRDALPGAMVAAEPVPARPRLKVIARRVPTRRKERREQQEQEEQRGRQELPDPEFSAGGPEPAGAALAVGTQTRSKRLPFSDTSFASLSDIGAERARYASFSETAAAGGFPPDRFETPVCPTAPFLDRLAVSREWPTLPPAEVVDGACPPGLVPISGSVTVADLLVPELGRLPPLVAALQIATIVSPPLEALDSWATVVAAGVAAALPVAPAPTPVPVVSLPSVPAPEPGLAVEWLERPALCATVPTIPAPASLPAAPPPVVLPAAPPLAVLPAAPPPAGLPAAPPPAGLPAAPPLAVVESIAAVTAVETVRLTTPIPFAGLRLVSSSGGEPAAQPERERPGTRAKGAPKAAPDPATDAGGNAGMGPVPGLGDDGDPDEDPDEDQDEDQEQTNAGGAARARASGPAPAVDEEAEDRSHRLRILEALLFASAEPLDQGALAERLGVARREVLTLLAVLQGHYAARGVTLLQREDRWAFRTAPDLAPLLCTEEESRRKLSRAAIETLAIIAYHQPVTRAEIESIRGVATSKGTLDLLMEANWIRPGKRRETPGRPLTWITTDHFLDYFGLTSLRDLPGVDELKASGLLDQRPMLAPIAGGLSAREGEIGDHEEDASQTAAKPARRAAEPRPVEGEGDQAQQPESEEEKGGEGDEDALPPGKTQIWNP